MADFENQPQVGLARSEIDKESLMHNIMHAHGLRSRKGCTYLAMPGGTGFQGTKSKLKAYLGPPINIR